MPGEEAVFGGGKTIRDGMAQSQRASAEGALDLYVRKGNDVAADQARALLARPATKA